MFLGVVQTAKLFHCVNNSTEFIQRPRDVYNEYKLYKGDVMHHMKVLMKECLNISDKRKSVYGDVPHQTLLTEDSFPTSVHSHLAKSLPSLKRK